MCRFEFFDKGEGRHKRIQAVSPSFFWIMEKRDTKRIQAVSPCRIHFGKGRREWKDIAHFCFLWKNKVWKLENTESFRQRKTEEQWRTNEERRRTAENLRENPHGNVTEAPRLGFSSRNQFFLLISSDSWITKRAEQNSFSLLPLFIGK